MRIAILSDIHANLEAFQAVLDDMDRQAPDAVVSLGDNVGYGADPDAVLALLRERGIPSVMGNHEHGLTAPGGMDWFNPTARKAVERTAELLAPESLAYISTLPPFLIMAGARFVHGMPPDKTHQYFFKYNDKALLRLFDAMPERIAFVGHTHMLEYARFDGRELERGELSKGKRLLDPASRYILNVGSVGQPRDGDKRAKYVLFDPDAPSIDARFIPYGAKTAADKILAAGMPEQYARKLL